MAAEVIKRERVEGADVDASVEGVRGGVHGVVVCAVNAVSE